MRSPQWWQRSLYLLSIFGYNNEKSVLPGEMSVVVLWMALISKGIFQIDHEDDPKNWRPHLLVLSGAPQKRWSLIELADGFSHNRSLMTVSSVLPSGSRNLAQQVKLEKTIRDYLDKRGVQALVRVVSATILLRADSA